MFGSWKRYKMDNKDMIREKLTGRCIPVRGNDIDTDRIIPARFMKVVTFSGIGEFAFYDERFESDGSKKSHAFNSELYRSASILLVNKNFGCGSSREHAPQSLYRFGIRAVLGESFAEIFEGNCGSMGIPALTASADIIEELMSGVENYSDIEMNIDIKLSKIEFNNKVYEINIPDSSRIALLKGTWDSTAALLASKDDIISKAGELPYFRGFT
jgi:3-isopropylmalate/(R)-2-methylmalate dehydratase small subunit